jgi:hypothetical protein
MEVWSVPIDGLFYSGTPSEVSLHGQVSGNPAIPRRVLCHRGWSFEVTSFQGVRYDRLSLYSICVPSSVSQISERVFLYAMDLCFVAFEFGSRLIHFATQAFQGCLKLKSICIPSAVETVGIYAFSACSALSSVMFERGSRLSSIGVAGFDECENLKWIGLPKSLAQLERWALTWKYLEFVVIDPDNRHFSISGNFLVDQDGTSIFGYLGVTTELCIPKVVERLRGGCLCSQSQLRSVTFESGSRLRQMEPFDGLLVTDIDCYSGKC